MRSTTIDNASGISRFDNSRTSESAHIQRGETEKAGSGWARLFCT
ncbi:hypothetical protein RHM62_05095 [Actimicrobium sp. CCC2.4]|nr:hypothetical protein [Actimicrobium sp. CCC2.4]WPX33221.1 hypothetical protein RHM62_05095 [Actimicrobium sp. CCC2.4]